MLFGTGCYYDNEEELYPPGIGVTCDTVAVSYATVVQPILQTNCYNCHAQGSSSGNVSLGNYQNVLVYVNNGSLYGAIAHLSGFSPMPKGGNQLLSCDINKIKSWIDAGALDN